MTKDDPFGLEQDAGRTRIRPVGQRAPTPGASRGGGDLPPDVTARLRQARAHDNPLVAAFSVLLGLAPELGRAEAPESAEVLRARLHDNLTYARDTAVSSGVRVDRADQAAWFVAALIDDIAINTPWGGHSSWPSQPLVANIFGDVDAGERFFERVEALIRYPERDPEMLELAFLCLSFGFRGKHRLSGPAGEGAIAQMRAQITRLLGDPDRAETPLSPHWQGVVSVDEKPRFALPLWSIGLVVIAVLAAIHVGLGMKLAARGQQLFTLASVLPPTERAGIFRPVRESVPAPAPLALEPVSFELLPLVAAAAPAVTAGALTGREDVSLAVIVVQADVPEVFQSSKADLTPVYGDLIASIAGVIIANAEVIGGVSVIGHTDSVPVQRSNPFGSNQGLSEARARTIADLLIAAGVPAELIATEGRAATEPIADDASREGRARNRRVEIVLQKRF